jgi:hypothetical protein
MKTHKTDRTGQVFGSLTAKEFSHLGKENSTAYWKYQCVCGKVHTARANTVAYVAKKSTNPELPSCGCKELEQKTKHGYRKLKNTHPAYKAWRGILTRCYDQNSEGYKWYGAYGVTICDEWKENPKAFIEWSLANGWKPNLHVDKDILCKEKGIFPHVYSPETCQWVTAKVNVGFATNRDNFGKHPNVRLSHEDVQNILNDYKNGQTNQSELARKYGLKSPSSVGRLIRLSKQALE